MMRISCFIVSFILTLPVFAQPNWQQIKQNAQFYVADTNFYSNPQILPINVGGWEDGLYVTRNGRNLYATYMPIDIISWLSDWQLCIDFNPYYRGPLLDIDTIFNLWGCANYIHSDIILTERLDTSQNFNPWHSCNLQKSLTFEGAPCGVLKNADTFDVFVFTADLWPNGTEIMFMQNVPVNPDYSLATPILSSPHNEDNPHIERLPNGDLILFFDRDRYVYYALSTDNGITWSPPTLVTNVINDHAPYDIQPHLWFDGADWWMYFCADNLQGMRSIYRSKQLIAGDWNSWSLKELVVAPTGINGGYGNVIGVGEPTLTAWGDLYFVTVYGNTLQPDTTDVFDCDPWLLKRKSLITATPIKISLNKLILSENPVKEFFYLRNVPVPSIIKIFDCVGREIESVSVNQPHEKIYFEASTWKEGVYFLECISENFHEKLKIIKIE